MAEVLDQSEVDALLAAVEAGDVDKAAGDGQRPERIIYSARRGGFLREAAQIQDYDFKRPERVSKDQMRALEHLHEGFSRNFGAALSGFLRMMVGVSVSSIEQMTFSEFTDSLPNPTCFNRLSAQPLGGSLCLDISPLIIYPVIDRLLGGASTDLFIPQRPLTAIEMRLVSKILDRATHALQEAWKNVALLKIDLVETESNPALVQVVPPNEVVVVVGFELKTGNRAGTMSLCIPYNVIEPIVDKLSDQSWGGYKHSDPDARVRGQLAEGLDRARIGVTGILADTTITLSELTGLEVGDVVLTEKPASASLALSVEGKRKFLGHLGQYKGNRAFKVAGPVQTQERMDR